MEKQKQILEKSLAAVWRMLQTAPNRSLAERAYNVLRQGATEALLRSRVSLSSAELVATQSVFEKFLGGKVYPVGLRQAAALSEPEFCTVSEMTGRRSGRQMSLAVPAEKRERLAEALRPIFKEMGEWRQLRAGDVLTTVGRRSPTAARRLWRESAVCALGLMAAALVGDEGAFQDYEVAFLLARRLPAVGCVNGRWLAVVR